MAFLGTLSASLDIFAALPGSKLFPFSKKNPFRKGIGAQKETVSHR